MIGLWFGTLSEILSWGTVEILQNRANNFFLNILYHGRERN